MGYFLVYILKSGFCVAVFYLFYRLFLSRETFFRFNIVVLLGLMLLSLLIPFVHFTTEEPTLIQRQAFDLEALLLMADGAAAESPANNPYAILLYVYPAGMLFFLYRMLVSVRKIRKIVGEARKTTLRGVTVYITAKEIAPFSWLDKVVISEKDWEENGGEILTHEIAHISAGHTSDLILMNLFALFQWFNPAVWLFKQELQALHEYQADEAVLKQGIDAKKYQLLLIKKAVGSQRFTSVANSFNQSNLRMRITMMLKGKSNPWRKLKIAGILPLAAVAFAAFARPEVSNELEKLSAVKITEIIPEVEIPQDKERVQAKQQMEVPVPPQAEVKPREGKWVKTEMEGLVAVDTIKPEPPKPAQVGKIPADVAYVVNGKLVSATFVNSLDPKDITRVDVVKTPVSPFKEQYSLKTNQGVVLITTKRNDKIDQKSLEQEHRDFNKKLNGALILVDGEVYNGALEDIDPHNIDNITVLKDADSLGKYQEKYGDKARNGVVQIELKK